MSLTNDQVTAKNFQKFAESFAEKINGVGIPDGGTTGQVLKKKSATDYDVDWDDEEGGGVTDFDDLTNRPQESEPIDISELNLPLPAKPTEYPILFDETGTEYKVGLYKRASDGKVKPVYRKDVYCGALPNTTEKIITHNISNIDKIVKIEGIAFASGSNTYMSLPLCYDNGSATSNTLLQVTLTTIRLAASDDRSAYNNSYVTIEYSKTTDEWKEV